MLKAIRTHYAIGVAILIALLPAPAWAQENHFALAYVSNTKAAPVGGGLYWVRTGQTPVGAYIDVKFSRTQVGWRDSYYSSVTLKDAEVIYGDTAIGQDTSIIMANVGFTHRTSDRVVAYGGVGYTWESSYRQYYDAFEILGDGGQYYVKVPGESNNRVNFNGGMLVTAGHWVAVIGYDTSPGSLNLGLGLYF